MVEGNIRVTLTSVLHETGDEELLSVSLNEGASVRIKDLKERTPFSLLDIKAMVLRPKIVYTSRGNYRLVDDIIGNVDGKLEHYVTYEEVKI
jgi:hypothetical protein